MFEFISESLYSNVYYLVCLFSAVFILLLYHSHDLVVRTAITYFGYILVCFIILYIGFRPLYSSFGDMLNYHAIFTNIENYEFSSASKDPTFYTLIYLLNYILSTDFLFLFIAAIYVWTMYFVAKLVNYKYRFLIFILLITPFSFWGYGVNGIRNGFAVSFLIIALFINPRWPRYFLMFLSIGLHASLIIPVTGYLLYKVKPKVNFFILIWLISVPLSLLGSVYFGAIFESLGFGGARMEYFNSSASDDKFSDTGFRIDFFIYSLTGVIPAIYCYKKNIVEWDKYNELISTFLFSNAIWIILIDVSFSNRFAYPSWALLGIIYCFYILSSFKEHMVKYYLFLAIIFNISMSIYLL
jgi:hypothetical protein